MAHVVTNGYEKWVYADSSVSTPIFYLFQTRGFCVVPFFLCSPRIAQFTFHLFEKQRLLGMHFFLSTCKHLRLRYFLKVHSHIYLSSSLLDFQFSPHFCQLFFLAKMYVQVSHILKLDTHTKIIQNMPLPFKFLGSGGEILFFLFVSKFFLLVSNIPYIRQFCSL